MATPLVPTFTITFDIVANTMDFLDTSTNRGATTYGTPRITDITNGIILYDGVGWHATAPVLDGDCPIDGSDTPVWVIEDIALATDPEVEYKFEYWTKKGTDAAVLVTRSFTLTYVPVTASLALTVSCSTSELTITDGADYGAAISGAEITPTYSRTLALTIPAGSGCTITPLSWVDTGATPARTIGGGSTSGTRIWTKVWQGTVETDATYVVNGWGTIKPAVVLIDTINGDTSKDVQCDATVCALATCYHNLLTRWYAAVTTNFKYALDKRDTVIEANGLWTELELYERCGLDTQDTIDKLAVLLGEENCDCSSSSSAVSIPVVPYAASSGSGSGTASTFVFTFDAADPATDDVGNNGDVWVNTTTWDVLQKEAGQWSTKGNIKGDDGDPGTDLTSLDVLLHDPTEYPTSVAHVAEEISFEVDIDNTMADEWDDFIMFIYDIKLAQNQRGKTVFVTVDNNTVVSYFTDQLITADNDRVIIMVKITFIETTTQHVFASVVHSGLPGAVVGPIVLRDQNFGLDTPKAVQLWGQNSEDFSSDIIGDNQLVKMYHRDTVLLPSSGLTTAGRGLVSQLFTATAGQTEFTVTAFDANEHYIPFIDSVSQSQAVVTRSGNVFTYPAGLALGQTLLIVD